MQTTSPLLTYLHLRLGTLGTPMLILLAVVLAVAGALAVTAMVEVFALAAEPVQVAPVRWIYRA